jgi:hypothetical protein
MPNKKEQHCISRTMTILTYEYRETIKLRAVCYRTIQSGQLSLTIRQALKEIKYAKYYEL